MKIKKIIIISASIFIAYCLFIHIAYSFFIPTERTDLPTEMQSVIDSINSNSSDDLEFIKKSFDFVNQRYSSGRLTYYITPSKLTQTNISLIWDSLGYMPCDKQTYVLELMLVHSGRFNNEEIKKGYSTCIISPHYYLKLRLNNGSKINLDVFSADFGKEFGKSSSIIC